MTAGVLFDAPGPRARRRHTVAAVVGVVIVLAVLAVVLWRFDAKGQLEAAKWKPLVQGELWNSYLWPGLKMTLKAAALSIVLASVFGGVMALGRLSSIAPLRWVCGVVVEVFRAIPVVVMMIFVFAMYVKYNAFPSEQNPLAAVVTALTLYNGSVICEVIRSGVGQLPKGQREAGLAVGLTPAQTLRTILLPQAVTAMLPSLVSQLVVVLKDTALGFNITFTELLYSANDAASNYGNLVPLMMLVAAMYIVVNYLITKLAERIERRLRRRGRPTAGPEATEGGGLAGAGAGPDMRHNQHT